MMKLEIATEPGGKRELYEFDEDTMPVQDAKFIKQRCEMGVLEWLRGIAVYDPDALIALMYLTKKRAGEAPKWAHFERYDLLKDFEMVNDEDDEDGDDQGDAEADSGQPAGKPAKSTASKKTAGKTPSSE